MGDNSYYKVALMNEVTKGVPPYPGKKTGEEDLSGIFTVIIHPNIYLELIVLFGYITFEIKFGYE
jgi:hypothetical protein